MGDFDIGLLGERLAIVGVPGRLLFVRIGVVFADGDARRNGEQSPALLTAHLVSFFDIGAAHLFDCLTSHLNLNYKIGYIFNSKGCPMLACTQRTSF